MLTVLTADFTEEWRHFSSEEKNMRPFHRICLHSLLIMIVTLAICLPLPNGYAIPTHTDLIFLCDGANYGYWRGSDRTKLPGIIAKLDPNKSDRTNRQGLSELQGLLEVYH